MSHPAPDGCTGCTWLLEEIRRLRELEEQFVKQRDAEMVRLVSDGIAALYEDLQRHLDRDHGNQDSLRAADPESLMATALRRNTHLVCEQQRVLLSLVSKSGFDHYCFTSPLFN